MPAVPLDEFDTQLEIPPLAVASVPDEIPPLAVPIQESTYQPPRPKNLKEAKLNLESALDEVERQRPTLEKMLVAAGLNLREGAVGTTKQAIGNLARSYSDIVAPNTPHAPGSFKFFLQLALNPWIGIGHKPEDPESPFNVLREGGKDLAKEGTDQLLEANELTQNLGGGVPVSSVASLASTAGASSPALLAAPLGLPAASIAAGLQSYGNNIDSFKNRLLELQPNLTEQEAFDKAMGPAAITGAVTGLLTRGFGGTEKFIENLTRNGLQQQGIKAALKEIFKSASLEFPEEYLDQLSQGFVEKAYIDPSKNIGDIFNDAGLAGLSGFALGGITTGGITGATKVGEVAVNRLRSYAQSPRIKAPTTGQQTQGLGQETQVPVYLRNTPQNGVETVPGNSIGAGINAAIARNREAGSVATPGGGRQPQQRIPIKIQSADGSIRDGEFNGYYDLRELGKGTPPSVGWLDANGKMTHGLLSPGETVIGDIPTFEEWKSGKTPKPKKQRPKLTDLNDEYNRAWSNSARWQYMLQEAKDIGDYIRDHQLEIFGPETRELKDLQGHVIDIIQILANKDPGMRIMVDQFDQKIADYILKNNPSIIEHEATRKSLMELAVDKYKAPVASTITGIYLLDGRHEVPESYKQFAIHKLVGDGMEATLANRLVEDPQELQDYKSDIDPELFYWIRKKIFPNTDSFERTLDKLKIDTSGTVQLFGLVPSVWNTLIETVRLAYRGGKTIAQAIDEGLAWLRANTTTPADEAGIRSELEKRFAVPTVPGNLPQEQIAGATAEIGRIAQDAYSKRERAGQELENLAYEKKQYRMAATGIKQLNDLATASFRQQGLDPETIAFPDATAGVRIEDGQITVDNTFVDALAVAHVPHNPENVQAMQGELYYERLAHRYNNLLEQVRSLQQVEQFYTNIKADPKEIKKVQKEISDISTQLSKIGGAEWNGATVQSRALEISTAEGVRVQRIAAMRSLGLGPVAEFFGRHVGAYRDFSERLKAGITLAQQVAGQTTDPDALKFALAEVNRWVNIPQDVKNAILTGRRLTQEQRSSIFAALGQIFEEFDYNKSRMSEMSASRIPEIDKQIRELLLKIANAKTDRGMAEVLLADVLNTLDGETGMTGNLRSMAENQALRERISAIESFANALGENQQTNQALYNWLTNPSTPKPIIPANANLGVDQATLSMIINEAERNPAFNSALLTLIQAHDKKIANLPITGLAAIEEAVKKNDLPAALAEASKLRKTAKANAKLASTTLKESLNQLEELQIERGSLENGTQIFSEVESSPEFTATRNAIANSPSGLVEQMVEQNHTATNFKPFGAKGIPSHTGLNLDASADPTFKAEWFKKIAEWHKTAQEHLDAYDAAAAFHAADPINNPDPRTMGFDVPKIRGLRDATKRFVPGSFLDLSLNTENKRWKVPWLVRALSKSSLFRQHDFAAKMVGGQAGTDLRARLADFVNHFLTGQSIRDKYKDIPNLIHAAMKSHPELGMNIQNYRTYFNEMAHWGRMFGSPLRVGFVLPIANKAVTAEDMALIQKERAYSEELRRRVTETNPTQGIRIKTPTRELIRPGAFVGDEGLPRFHNKGADRFIADVVGIYGDSTGFSPATNLGVTSTDPIVQFWNRNPDLLKQHILDARRQDRTMRQIPEMQAAERDLSSNWLLNGTQAVDSLDQLVTLLTPHYPPIPGISTRDQVIEALNNELMQYRDAAKRIQSERAERAQARNSRPGIAFSANNEFTKPAAKLELPSSMYDYGSLTPAEHLLNSSRANHERAVAYATAVERALADITARYNDYQAGKIDAKTAAEAYGGSIKEMTDVMGILRKVADDFEAAYATGSLTSAPKGIVNDSLGLLTSAILALPTVGLRNMTQGQFEVYAMTRAMGLAGHWMSAWNALKAIPKTLTRFGLHAVDGAIRKTNLGLAHLTGTNRHHLENIIKDIGDMFAPDFRASADRIQNLGLDNRDSFLQRLKRIWQETQEFVSREDQEKAWAVGGQRVGKTAAIPFKIARALFDKIGVQQYDFAINTTALSFAENVKERLKQVAIDYGNARQHLGDFDPLNRAWDLTPSEWSTFETDAENEDSLANFRLFLEGSASPEGFQLERNLWNFYKEFTGGNPQAQILTDRQFDAITQKLIAELNASTPANRPSASAASPIVRNLLLLQGYPSDLMLKIFNSAFGGIRDRSKTANAIAKAPGLGFMALMAILIGYITSAITGSWEKYVRGRQPTLATPLDADFYSNIKRFSEGTLALGAAQFGYLGDLVLGMLGEVRGNRGFDPTGRILGVSLISRALNAVRGAYNTYKGAGSVSDAMVPFSDVGRSMVPFWLETENVLGDAQGATKQAERVLRGEAQVQGMLEGRSGFQPPTYGPTTVVRRNIGDAISKWYAAQQSGDTVTAANEMARAKAELLKLEEYHYNKYIEAGKDPAAARTLAQRDAYNDYQDINPVISALLGRRPTDAQYQLLRQGTTGDRGEIVDRGIRAWQAGSVSLFGKAGNITRQDVAAARSAGAGGRGFALPGATMAKFPRFAGVTRTRAAGTRVQGPARTVRNTVRNLMRSPIQAVKIGRRQRSTIPKLKIKRIKAPTVAKSNRQKRSRLRSIA